MSIKVRFADGDADSQARVAVREEQMRATLATQRSRAMSRRVREFFNAIESVTFPSAETAPRWAQDPLEYVLRGALPPEDTVSETTPAEEEVVSDEPPEGRDAPAS